ncbi:FKBP-type peptidyl-prolyl cis-trans isomerase [Lacibacter sediminis]|uniref:peptidylprolyl isomerase n=1 Tax=Lacibacter sediminis TaxID=2760713 RepID=A0A7G5XLL1_9BACT|nr:FKBP-type peptidyl-prolyl cis-trans isomerase [Lacibacter sediminis]QNA46364.1 FKBP-type peptidyl-prolyl cis-trans isomerase [Lacibacter sediminis]
MKTIQSIFVALLAVTVLASCGGGSFKKTKGGLLYKIIPGSKGKKVSAGKFFELQFGETRYKGSDKDTLLSDPANVGSQIVPFDSATLPPDYYAIFAAMSKGDSVIIRQSTDSIIKQSQGQGLPPFIKKGAFIVSTFKVLDVLDTKEDADKANLAIMERARTRDSIRAIEQIKKDDKVIADHLAKNNITATKTAKGVYVTISNPGAAVKAADGQQVSVKYTGMSLEGTKFDSNVDSTFGHLDPYTFVLGSVPPGSIAGFEDAIKQIGKGGKLKAYIPSALAYGAQGSPPRIKANESLVFEIELIDVTTPKPAAPPTAPGGNPNGQQ